MGNIGLQELTRWANELLAEAPELLDIRVVAAREGEPPISLVKSSDISPYKLEENPGAAALLQPGYCLSKIAVPFLASDLIDEGITLDEPLGEHVAGLPKWLGACPIAAALNHELPSGPGHMEYRLSPSSDKEKLLNADDRAAGPGFSEIRSSWLIEQCWRSSGHSGTPPDLSRSGLALFPDDAYLASQEQRLIPNACKDGGATFPLYEEVSMPELGLCSPSVCGFINPVGMAQLAQILLDAGRGKGRRSLVEVMSNSSDAKFDPRMQRSVTWRGGLISDASAGLLGDGWGPEAMGLSVGLLAGAVIADPSFGVLCFMSTGLVVPDTERSAMLRHRSMTALAEANW